MVSLVFFWGSPLFFGRVHFIPLTIHTFFITLVFIFLTLVNSTEEGHICRPLLIGHPGRSKIFVFLGVGDGYQRHMHGTRGERHHHLAMVVVENGDGVDGWNMRVVGKKEKKRRKMGERLDGKREAQAESRRAGKELVSSIQV